MIDATLHRKVDRFLLDSVPNLWCEGRYLRVYLRHSQRVLGQHGRLRCVDIATVALDETSQRRQGMFRSFLDFIEARPHNLYVENVLDQWLRDYFLRRGYTPAPARDLIDEARSFFSLTTDPFRHLI